METIERTMMLQRIARWSRPLGSVFRSPGPAGPGHKRSVGALLKADSDLVKIVYSDSNARINEPKIFV